jgi:epsilon-lactone hydrolase
MTVDSDAAGRRLERLRAALRRNQLAPDAPIAVLRAQFEAAMTRTPPAEEAIVEQVTLDELSALRVAPRASTSAGLLLLYLHGGGYVLGSARTAAPLASRIALAGQATVICLDYALAPEAPHPAALEQVVSACETLRRPGVRLMIGGDSAGGGLAVAACLALRDRGGRLPERILLLSPWVDLTVTQPSVAENADLDPVAPPALLRRMATLYADGGLAEPTVSPRFADLAGLPPMLIHASRAEVLRDDAIALAETARRDGVEVALELWDDLPHVWHGFAPVLPEANAAIDAVGAWLRAADERPKLFHP